MKRGFLKWLPLFLLPTLLAFIIAFLVPFVFGIGLSFTEFTTVTDAKFVGLSNYRALLTDGNGFLSSLWFTVRFAIVSVITINVFAFLFSITIPP